MNIVLHKKLNYKGQLYLIFSSKPPSLYETENPC